MRIRVHRSRPEPWAVRKKAAPHKLALPLWAFEWFWEWVAFVLSNWSLLAVLEYLGSFSILIAVIFYFAESGDRIKQKHYQAWQVINTSQGKGGSGGRIEALQELNQDRVPLVGVDVSGAYLQGVELKRASLVRSNFNSADLRESDFSSTDLSNADLRSANFRESHLRAANLQGANAADADFFGADLSDADLSGTTLDNADLRSANLANLRWHDVHSLKNANLFGVKNAPGGFLAWALQHGAVQNESDSK